MKRTATHIAVRDWIWGLLTCRQPPQTNQLYTLPMHLLPAKRIVTVKFLSGVVDKHYSLMQFCRNAFLSLLEGIYLLETCKNGCHRERFPLIDYNRLSTGHILIFLIDRGAPAIYSWEIVYLQARGERAPSYNSISTFIWNDSFHMYKLSRWISDRSHSWKISICLESSYEYKPPWQKNVWKKIYFHTRTHTDSLAFLASAWTITNMPYLNPYPNANLTLILILTLEHILNLKITWGPTICPHKDKCPQHGSIFPKV